MSMILFTRSSENLETVIAEANELIQYKRLRGWDNAVNRVLGVVVRDGLHMDLPVWGTFNLEQGTGVLFRKGCHDYNGGACDEDDIALRDAFTSRDAWALCVFDGPGLRNVPNNEIRRERLVVMMQEIFRDSRWAFLPVYRQSMEKDVPKTFEQTSSSRLFDDYEQGISGDFNTIAASTMQIPA